MTEISKVGVHRSVEAVVPPTQFERHLHAADVAVVETVPAAGDVEVLVTLEYEPAFLDADLEWIHSIQSGVDRFPTAALERAGIVLTSSRGIHRASVGEAVIGYMLAFSRGLPRAVRQQEAHEWARPPWDALFTLAGETVCIVGLGTLGRAIADRAGALDMTVHGVNSDGEPVPGVDQVVPAADLDSAIGAARFVVLSVPLLPATEHLISTAQLERMRPTSYLINIARGSVVDEPALVEALQSDSIAGAALDVVATEPLPSSSPLWDLPNVLLTPHTAGVWAGYAESVAAIVDANLAHRRAGEPMENRIV